jgi:hypothetical protein
MKQMSFLQVGLLAVLMITVASCGVPLGATDDYYDEAPARRNVYYSDPYYGGGNTIIVERDPFTGRYYQVSPYSGVYRNAPAYPYNSRRYNSRRYNTGRYYNNRSNAGSNNGYYRKYPQTQAQPLQQTPAQREQVQQQRDQAKESILGKKRN